MRKSVLVLLTFVLLCTNVFAYRAETTVNKDFASGTYYGVRCIDTNGKFFVGIINDTAVRSTDFKTWIKIPEVTGVHTIQCINGIFMAIGKGQTFFSEDTVSWEPATNNLPGNPDGDYVIKNYGSIVAFVPQHGTYQSFNGHSWQKIMNIPEGIKMNIVNNKIMFFSHGYMRGLYYSTTGEYFQKAEIPEFKESYGGSNIYYENGEYCLTDYWTPVDDESYNTVWYSKDLVNWKSRLEERPKLAKNYGSFVEIKGELCEFTQNGQGKYDMTEGDGANLPYVHYNFSDFGVFGWSTSRLSYFVAKDGTMLKYDGRELQLVQTQVKDNAFYALTKNNTIWKSQSGQNWVKVNESIDPAPVIKNSASNGEFTLTSEFIERGSQAGRDINEEITAQIKYPDGTTKKVAYEYAKDDYVKVIGGNGFFLLGGFSLYDGWYYSRDGITREFKVDGLPSSRDMNDDNLIANDKYFMSYSPTFGTINYGKLSQFEQFNNEPKPVRVKLNDEYLSFATPPVIKNDRTLIPVRFFFERAGAKVEWNPSEYAATITYGDTSVKVKIDDDTAYVNGAAKKLDCPAALINEKTMIPLRFISEELGFTVNWYADEFTAEIIK